MSLDARQADALMREASGQTWSSELVGIGGTSAGTLFVAFKRRLGLRRLETDCAGGTATDAAAAAWSWRVTAARKAALQKSNYMANTVNENG